MIKLHKFDDSIFDSIVHTQAYFDAISIRLHYQSMILFYCNFLEELREINAPGHVELVERPMKYSMQRGLTEKVLDIKQPKRETLLYLKRCIYDPLLINKAEIALDQIFSSRQEAELFQMFLVQSLIQPGNDQPVVVTNDTVYFKRRKTRKGRLSDKNYVIYSKKGARWYHDAPCTHFEVRYNTSGELRKLGIARIDDLLAFDFKAYFAKELHLYQIDNDATLARMAKRVVGKGKAKKQWWNKLYPMSGGQPRVMDFLKRYRRAFLLFSTVEMFGEEVVSAQNLKLTIDTWRDGAVEEIQTAESYLRSLDELKAKMTKPQRPKRYFEARYFDRIDTSRMLNLENVLSE